MNSRACCSLILIGLGRTFLFLSVSFLLGLYWEGDEVDVVVLVPAEDFADRGRVQQLDRGLVGWHVDHSRDKLSGLGFVV